MFILQAEDRQDSSTLRDLLSSEQTDENCLLGLADTDTDLKVMKLEETCELYKSAHSWLCDGLVLKLMEPHGDDNTELFKVKTTELNKPVTDSPSSSDNLEAVPACDHLLREG